MKPSEFLDVRDTRTHSYAESFDDSMREFQIRTEPALSFLRKTQPQPSLVMEKFFCDLLGRFSTGHFDTLVSFLCAHNLPLGPVYDPNAHTKNYNYVALIGHAVRVGS